MKRNQSLLMGVREWKPGLKLNIQKPKIMASGSITSWQIGWEKVETVTDFVFLGSKITANGYCSCEIKWCLFLARKAITILDESRGIILLTEVHIVKAMIFPAVMYWCETWTEMKAESRRIDAFELWCWKTPESPLACKEIKPVNPIGNQP